VFRRSPAAMAGGSFGAAFAAVLFGGFALVVYAGVLMDDLVIRLVYGSIPAFFAILMGTSAVAAFQRGRDSRVAEIGPDGAWTPEMGFVAWRDMAAVRLEVVAGPAGPRNSRIAHRRRLGFVPAEGHVKPVTAATLALRMNEAYLRLVRMLAPQVRLGPIDLAPFGISEVDLPRDFDAVLAETRRYVEVAEQAAASS
jgi:hypothetical protein